MVNRVIRLSVIVVLLLVTPVSLVPGPAAAQKALTDAPKTCPR